MNARSLKFIALFFLATACSPFKIDKPPTTYAWRAQDTVESVSARFRVDPLDLRRLNGIYEPEDLEAGMVLIIPPAKRPSAGRTPTPEKKRPKLEFIPPSEGSVSSRFGKRWGRFHYGTDFRADRGKTVRASERGIVIFSGRQSGYGKVLIIRHDSRFQTLYAHLEKTSVKKGRKVGRGEKIGVMGNTGRSTGIHLHFEIHDNGKAVNPERVLKRRTALLPSSFREASR